MFLRKVKFSRAEFDEMLQPAVYAAMRGGEPIYIGYATKGMERVCQQIPKHANRYKAFQECDEVIVRFYNTAEEALIAETELIHRYHPEQNGQCAICTKEGKKSTVIGPNVESVKKAQEKHLKTATYLVEQYGGIPGHQHLEKLDLNTFRAYVRNHPVLFESFPRVMLPSGSIRLDQTSVSGRRIAEACRRAGIPWPPRA